jgi:hypothetical protein
MKQLICAIAAATAITAAIDSAQAGSLRQGSSQDPYDSYIQPVVATATQPDPSPVYEYQVIPAPGAAQITTTARSRNSNAVLSKSALTTSQPAQQVPEPSIAVGMLVLTLAALRRLAIDRSHNDVNAAENHDDIG